MAVWERMADEPEESYARFLIYRGLGPLRTLPYAEKTATGSKKKQASGTWTKDSTTYKWVERCTAWDISLLTKNGERLGYVFIGILEKMAEQLAERVASGLAKPKTQRDVIEWLKTLSPYLTPQLIEKIRSQPPGANSLPSDVDGPSESSE